MIYKADLPLRPAASRAPPLLRTGLPGEGQRHRDRARRARHQDSQLAGPRCSNTSSTPSSTSRGDRCRKCSPRRGRTVSAPPRSEHRRLRDDQPGPAKPRRARHRCSNPLGHAAAQGRLDHLPGRHRHAPYAHWNSGSDRHEFPRRRQRVVPASTPTRLAMIIAVLEQQRRTTALATATSSPATRGIRVVSPPPISPSSSPNRQRTTAAARSGPRAIGGGRPGQSPRCHADPDTCHRGRAPRLPPLVCPPRRRALAPARRPVIRRRSRTASSPCA